MTKKRKRPTIRNTLETPAIRNPIAKHAHKSNRCQVFRDKTKYDRKANKKSFEPFPIELFKVSMGNGLKGLCV